MMLLLKDTKKVVFGTGKVNRRFIEFFLLIGFFTIFITLAVGHGESKVGADMKVPLKSKKKYIAPTSIQHDICCCIMMYKQQTYDNWENNQTQLPLNRDDSIQAEDAVMDVETSVSGGNYNLTFRISDDGYIKVLTPFWLGYCYGSDWPYCCFNHQIICCALQWCFPWINMNCSISFWRCIRKGNCYLIYPYYNWFFWILCVYFGCC